MLSLVVSCHRLGEIKKTSKTVWALFLDKTQIMFYDVPSKHNCYKYQKMYRIYFLTLYIIEISNASSIFTFCTNKKTGNLAEILVLKN